MNLFGNAGQSTLIIGPEQSYASYIASTSAFEIGTDGKSFVIYLVESPTEADQIIQRATEFRQARCLPIGHRLNLRCVDISRYSTPEALLKALSSEVGQAQDLLFVHDRTSKLLPTTPHHYWFPRAEAVALEFGAMVVTAAHYGPDGRSAPDLMAYPCDVIWQCRPHARSARATLHPTKGAGNEPIEFGGKRYGLNGLLFEPDKIQEFEHA